jgi:hypothetical protein
MAFEAKVTNEPPNARKNILYKLKEPDPKMYPIIEEKTTNKDNRNFINAAKLVAFFDKKLFIVSSLLILQNNF